VSSVIDIYYNRPLQIPTFDTVAVSPEILDKYVGIYANSQAPVKFTITRKGAKLFVQPGNESAAAVEATATNKFQFGGGKIVLEFDATKGQMILRRGGGERVFTKEK
jgi:D-alanyl-D-alanine carboxypeptidase